MPPFALCTWRFLLAAFPPKIEGGVIVPFLLVVAAAFAWAAGHLIAKKAGRVDLPSFIGWSSLAAPVPGGLVFAVFGPRIARSRRSRIGRLT